VVLLDKQGQPNSKLDSCEVELSVHSNDKPPRRIETNHEGNSIFKGRVVETLTGGRCVFENVQVREVSSHYRTGKVLLKAEISCLKLADTVKPMLQEVVIKAKKARPEKEKSDNKESS
jgi:hypothetical protein